MPYQVLNDDDTPMDARFDIDGSDIVYHSRGGSRFRGAVNSDYGPGLRLLLTRLAHSDVLVTDAWVDSANVQIIPLADRRLVDAGFVPRDPGRLFTQLSARMKEIGRPENSGQKGGNSTKRIRLKTSAPSQTDLVGILKGRRIDQDFRSLDRLPAEDLRKVTAEHLWKALELLRSGPSDHGFEESTRFDLVLDDGSRFPPKAVFGIAVGLALEMKILPKHFVGGEGSVCFDVLRQNGYSIVPKGQGQEAASRDRLFPPEDQDKEWAEGGLKYVRHLRRERKSGLSKAKKVAFRRVHGKLFCERCGLDPLEVYGNEAGESCIEVHHTKPVSQMTDEDTTVLEDLQCLCANCHRVVHREIRMCSLDSDDASG